MKRWQQIPNLKKEKKHVVSQIYHWLINDLLNLFRISQLLWIISSAYLESLLLSVIQPVGGGERITIFKKIEKKKREQTRIWKHS